MEMKFRRDNRIVSRALIDYIKTNTSVRVNSVINKKAYLSGGYPLPLFNQMWESAHGNNLNKNASIAIINDYALEVTYELLHKEFKNITIIATHDNIYNTVNDLMKYFYELPIKINVMKLEEVIMNKPEFDLIIANPPFSVASNVISSCLPHAQVMSVLMPISKYKANNLFKHVKHIEMIDDTSFDAMIGGNTSIAVLTNDTYETVLEKFELHRITKFRDFFDLNFKKNPIYIKRFEAGFAARKHISYDVDTSFVISLRASTNGVHRSGNDVDYNLHFKNVIVNVTSAVLILPTRKHKENLNRFWYGNPLMTELLHAFNCPGGICELCIPRIDYSVDRDYEHLTIEDLMKILEEES